MALCVCDDQVGTVERISTREGEKENVAMKERTGVIRFRAHSVYSFRHLMLIIDDILSLIV